MSGALLLGHGVVFLRVDHCVDVREWVSEWMASRKEWE